MTATRLRQILNRNITLLQVAPEHGVACWFYVRLRPSKRMALELAVRQGKIDFSEFGEILSSGYGDTPPSHIRWAMEQA